MIYYDVDEIQNFSIDNLLIFWIDNDFFIPFAYQHKAWYDHVDSTEKV